MLVTPEGSTLTLVTQPDHAWFSGELTSLWRTHGLPDNPRRAEILFAVREHDNGWREADAAPRCDPETGRPLDFLAMPREERIEIWERGTARFAGEHPYAALLITRHALSLHGDRRGQEEWQAFLDYLDELERGLLEETGVPEETVAADYRLLDVADLLSLAACNRWRQPFERHGLQGELRDGTLHLDPFPLAGATTFRVPCRRIPDRRYGGDADLGGALAAARWEELAVKVAGWEEGAAPGR
ncbi:MAG TPA: DUF3891 family protein [Thermoanaerobaculia bacterium]|nr:DUF3891 family protein [Thermoanaerobaculia bacterium]